MRFLNQLYRVITDAIPASIAGRVDLLRPSLADAWDGPLNGQQRRREIVREIAAALAVDRVIETGTYRGTSTAFFADVFGAPVDSVENDLRFFTYSRRRLADYASVSIALGESRDFLRRLADRPNASDEVVFIYLDAHWERDLPLREEMEIIATGWRRAVVMIDDFEVDGDPGYTFDDYGFGRRLTAGYLPPLEGWSPLFYPAARSAEETGARRGCCVIASSALTEVIGRMASLRSACVANSDA